MSLSSKHTQTELIKTLVIIVGNARGGEEAWNSMYKYLLEPFSADLCLLFGKTNDRSSSLYKRAKYIWEIEEYVNWREYYEKNVTGPWYEVLKYHERETLAGGIDNFKGSGAILLAFRHFLKNNYKNELLKYDRIILTRSDYFYIDCHPILPNNFFYIIEGEDFEGFCDRHHVFPSSMVDQVLGVIEFLVDTKNYDYLTNKSRFLNLERSLLETYKNNKIIDKIKRVKQTQFCVALSTDQTRWKKADRYMLGSNTLLIKYQKEYYRALRNKYGLIIGLILRSIFYFKKYFN